ncbi:HU family DNA-binding protein [Metasolibacillus meyeri]|uniref:HU family DNA-binding protein n=1 Tax=Metasolibacillus meyeri TaxID=1071052 RepID=A0AAW9NS61_9BACL|nr:HU family DNA-binding protein [Metasolibacillus meyeri]MEC1179187.1 HU family DNA-binding protein [Metasolibacillus meyeri]
MNTVALAKKVQAELEELVNTKLTTDKARAIVDTIFNTIGDTIATNEKVSITRFGDFAKSERVARKGCNPQTGEEMMIPAFYVAKFKAAKALKEKIK